MNMIREKRNLIRIFLLAAGIALLVAGLLTGGFHEVMGKAVMICMECIGIG